MDILNVDGDVVNVKYPACLDLTDLESFSLIYNLLWTTDKSRRKFKARIVDTILFRKGEPFRWLFTSEKTQEIMKKKADRLTSSGDLIQAMKTRSRSLKGQKDHHSRSKIATVFCLGSQQSISAVQLDENELTILLQGNLHEVIAIQAFMGGYPLKGSGIFEHSVTRQIDKVFESHFNFETYELVQPANQIAVSTFARGVQRLAVLESQHDIIKTFTKRLIKHIEDATEMKLSMMVLTFTFNSTWVPYFVCARSIRLDCVPPRYQHVSDRANLIFPDGMVGAELPLVEDRSQLLLSLLPSGPPVKTFRHTTAADTTRSGHQQPLIAQSFSEQTQRPRSDKGAAQSNEYGVTWKSDSNGKELATLNVPNPDPNFTNAEVKDDEMKALLNMNTFDLKKVIECKRRPLSANITQVTARYKDAETGRSLSHGPNRPPEALPPQRHRLVTESSKQRMTYYISQIKEIRQVPFEATLRPRPASALAIKSRGDSSSGAVGLGTGLGVGNHGVESGNRRASGLERLTFGQTGTSCFGDFCDFLAPRSAPGGAGGVGRLQPTPGALPERDCPHQLPFKSVLMARAEAEFLNGKKDFELDKAATHWELRSQTSDEDQLMTFAARSHLFRVAKLCEAEARRYMADGSHGRPFAEWDSLNAVYRRLVYANALAMVQYYYTVPLCKVCYKLYTFLDMQRDVIVLHHPVHNDIHKAGLSAAARLSSKQRGAAHRDPAIDADDEGGEAGGGGGQHEAQQAEAPYYSPSKEQQAAKARAARARASTSGETSREGGGTSRQQPPVSERGETLQGAAADVIDEEEDEDEDEDGDEFEDEEDDVVEELPGPAVGPIGRLRSGRRGLPGGAGLGAMAGGAIGAATGGASGPVVLMGASGPALASDRFRQRWAAGDSVGVKQFIPARARSSMLQKPSSKTKVPMGSALLKFQQSKQIAATGGREEPPRGGGKGKAARGPASAVGARDDDGDDDDDDDDDDGDEEYGTDGSDAGYGTGSGAGLGYTGGGGGGGGGGERLSGLEVVRSRRRELEWREQQGGKYVETQLLEQQQQLQQQKMRSVASEPGLNNHTGRGRIGEGGKPARPRSANASTVGSSGATASRGHTHTRGVYSSVQPPSPTSSSRAVVAPEATEYLSSGLGQVQRVGRGIEGGASPDPRGQEPEPLVSLGFTKNGNTISSWVKLMTTGANEHTPADPTAKRRQQQQLHQQLQQHDSKRHYETGLDRLPLKSDAVASNNQFIQFNIKEQQQLTKHVRPASASAVRSSGGSSSGASRPTSKTEKQQLSSGANKRNMVAGAAASDEEEEEGIGASRGGNGSGSGGMRRPASMPAGLGGGGGGGTKARAVPPAMGGESVPFSAGVYSHRVSDRDSDRVADRGRVDAAAAPTVTTADISYPSYPYPSERAYPVPMSHAPTPSQGQQGQPGHRGHYEELYAYSTLPFMQAPLLSALGAHGEAPGESPTEDNMQDGSLVAEEGSSVVMPSSPLIPGFFSPAPVMPAPPIR